MKLIYYIPNKILKRFLLIIFILQSTILFSQTNISGVVNTYRSVIEIIPAKACIRVSNISGITVNSMIMLVQMKGATINTSNSASFGDTTLTNEAGFYEIGTICYIKDDSVFLFHNLLNNYNTATGKVQLVLFAEYNSATVIDTLKAEPWNEATGTGGVIALFSVLNITLNAPIYADTSGYHGGASYNHSGTCNIIQQAGTGFVYDATSSGNLNGAYKGEGIATVGAMQDGAKGAPANGGGGGNNHNNSGGGGANLSAGGNGGANSSSGPLGCNTANNQGRGGKALQSWNGKKIFLGGGGGAGHANNGTANFNYGGNGGGIIFIWAGQITGNNQKIMANGGNGGASQSDGAGGGGAGGTIIMHVPNYIGTLFIEANGGNGGNSDDGGVTGRCFGGGGGGSGGTVYFNDAVPAISTTTNGGLEGIETGRDGTCGAIQPATAGNAGQQFSSYTFSRSMSNANYCSLLLPSKLIYFKGALLNKKIQLSWQLQNPELVNYFTVEKRNYNQDWVEIATISANNVAENYSTIDNSILSGNNFYRLKVIEKSTSFYYSDTRMIFCDLVDTEFTLYPNPALSIVTIFRKIAGPANLKLTDMMGKVILHQTIINKQEKIRLPLLSPGVYLVQINQSIRKLVIR